MAKPDLKEALDNLEMTYSEVVEISNEMLKEVFNPINFLVKEVESHVNDFTVDEIRNYMMRLQLRAYEISELKDKSALKAELSEALQKEKIARSFNEAEGTAAVKEKAALLAACQETVVESLYNLVANLLRTKLDQLHRLVDCLKSILMSRMQEAKLSMNGIE